MEPAAAVFQTKSAGRLLLVAKLKKQETPQCAGSKSREENVGERDGVNVAPMAREKVVKR
jgi:hypothetical protein